MNNIIINILGPVGSGKTAIQQYLADCLSRKFNSVITDWGVDGDPNRSLDDAETFMAIVSDKTTIKIKTQNYDPKD